MYNILSINLIGVGMRLLCFACQLFKGRRINFSWNPIFLVDEGAYVPHRYHVMSDTFLYSLSIMDLFVSNLQFIDKLINI